MFLCITDGGAGGAVISSVVMIIAIAMAMMFM